MLLVATLLHFFKVYGECPEEDKTRYQHYKNTLDNAILIFNHPTFYDHIVVMKELGETFRFVMSHKYMFPPFNSIAANMDSIIVYPRNQTSQLIARGVQERKGGDPLIAISPHGGEISSHPLDLPTFRTGAFLARPSVIPVVIKYFPSEPWTSGSLHRIVMKRLMGDPIQYSVRVLEAIETREGEDAHDFADRCRTEMSKALSEMQPNKRMHLPMTYYTCYLFLVCAIITCARELYAYSIGMFLVFLTSVLYHGSFCDPMYKRLDMASNIILASGFSAHLLANNQYTPLIWLLTASIAYIGKLNHALFVHVPIAMGFLNIQ